MNVLEAHTKGISVCDVRYRKVTWHGALLGMFGEIVLMLSPKDVMYASSASHLDTRALSIPRASRPMITLHSIVLDIRFLICRTYSVFKSRAAAGGDDFILLVSELYFPASAVSNKHTKLYLRNVHCSPRCSNGAIEPASVYTCHDLKRPGNLPREVVRLYGFTDLLPEYQSVPRYSFSSTANRLIKQSQPQWR